MEVIYDKQFNSNFKLPRIKEFEDLGLGIFVHWGLYSLMEQGEWTQQIHKVEKETYEELKNNFFADGFDAKKFVKLVKQMGGKYITLTTKHHDGFYLYDTGGLSFFDSVHSPAGRDLIQEFVTACNEESIKPFFYMATYDWYSDLFYSDFSAYLEYLKESVRILCTNYGEIGGFWFDGNWSKKDEDWKVNELYQMIRHYQPEAIIVNNTGLEEQGKMIDSEIDSVTYEKGVPQTINEEMGFDKYVAKEICMTMNEHWGYAKNDLKIKSLAEIIELLCHARKVGANLLLNIPFNGSGSVPIIYQEYMKAVGQWMDEFGEAIYFPRPTSVQTKSNKKDFVLKNEDSLYFFFHDMKVMGDKNVVLSDDPIDPRTFTECFDKIESVHWLDNQEHITFMNDSREGVITLNAGGYVYGSDWVVRVAKAKIKK